MGLPDAKDEDFLVLPESSMTRLASDFEANGYARSLGDSEYPEHFISLRKDAINVIIVPSSAEFYGFMAAFFLCKRYQVNNKQHRVLIHESCRTRPYTWVEHTVVNKQVIVTDTAHKENRK
jgi:hypothetical protein